MDLSQKTCIPCQGGEPTLSQEEVFTYLKDLKGGWSLERDPDKIVRTFEFADFSTALEFVNKVGEIAESEGHHPNIYIHSYKRVRLELWTHKIGGLHENDFILAAKIDKL